MLHCTNGGGGGFCTRDFLIEWMNVVRSDRVLCIVYACLVLDKSFTMLIRASFSKPLYFDLDMVCFI